MNKIPKIIHYCWFGNGEKTELSKKCIEGWKSKLVDYEFIEWNENNFNINSNQYIKEAYENKKYAFVSDYVRLYALLNYGGIYLDTDVELIGDFSKFLELNAFAGFEDQELISTAIIGSKKKNIIIKEWFDTYSDRVFVKNGKIDYTTNVRVFTNILLKYNLIQNNSFQKLYNEEICIYPSSYFSPLKFGTKKPSITSNTITVHWFEGSWTTVKKRLKIKTIVFIKSIIGFNKYNKIKQILKYNSIN